MNVNKRGPQPSMISHSTFLKNTCKSRWLGKSLQWVTGIYNYCYNGYENSILYQKCDKLSYDKAIVVSKY